MRQLSLLFLLACWPLVAYAQSPDSLVLSFQAQGVSLEAAFKQLEGQTGLRMYYNPSALPAKTVRVAMADTRLPEILSEVLRNTRLGFFFYRDYAVVVVPEEMLANRYSAAYYETLKTARKRAESPMEESATYILVGKPDQVHPSGTAKVNFRILDAADKDPVPGAALQWPDLADKDAKTDRGGRATLTLPTGEHKIKIQTVGFASYEGTIAVWNDGDCLIRLIPLPELLTEVQISAEAADANLSKGQVSVTKLDVKAIRKMPTLLGEADVVRSLLYTTGVTSVGEGAAGFNVRGGDTDQNLTLQDEMVLFNSSHALGFFSTYNTDLVSRVELYKSILPAEYGGRLSSVLDVRMGEGSTERWKLKGGVGLVTARLGVEGPLRKGSTTLNAGMRASYSDWVLHLFKDIKLKRSSASFYDANVGITHRWNKRNTLTASFYAAGDQFTYNNLFGFQYQTRSGQLIYRRSFSERFFSRFSISGGTYNSEQTNTDGTLSGLLRTGLAHVKIKEVLTRHLKNDVKLDMGLESVFYKVNPGEQAPIGPVSIVQSRVLEREQGLESAIFGSAEWFVSKKLLVVGGLRLNHYRFLGPKTVLQYNGLPDIATAGDTTRYGSGASIASYTYLEPRLSLRYRLNRNNSIKGGYARTSQFINQIFNSDTPTPTSQYQLSTPYIPPFRAHNLSVGYFRNTEENKWELSSEVFYRAIDQLWDYRDFARLNANPTLEREIREGVGKAYGLELSARTTRKTYSGYAGYTYSRALRRVAGINEGTWYPSNFDKPHILNLIFNYNLSLRHTLTFNFTYSTGRPTTAPLTSYRYANNIIVPVYSPRNKSRIPDYHRLDVSYTIGQGYNKRKTFKTSWNLSVYNLYARRNAFSVFFTQSPENETVANRLAILGTVFPAITLNIETK